MITLSCSSGLSKVQILRICISTIMLLACGFPLFAQDFREVLDLSDSTQVYVLETHRGDRFIGQVKSIRDEVVIFYFRETERLSFPFSNIKKIYPLPAPNSSANFRPLYLSALPTAYNLPKGTWEYRNYDVLWNTIHYGVSDQFSVGGGFVIPFLFSFKMKWTDVVADKLTIGLHNQNVINLRDGGGAVSSFSLLGTYGQPDRFLNIGIGTFWEWAYLDEAIQFISLGGNRQFNKRIGGHIELNTLFVEGEVIVFPTAAFNYYGKNNRLSLGLSVETTNDFFGIFAIPLLSFNQRF